MSYTQGTTHYNLPQTLGDDKRDWFDTNQAFADVDSALFTSYEGVQTLDRDLTKVKSDLLTAQSDVTSLKSHDAQTDVKVSALETLTAQHTVEIEDVRNDAEDMICAVDEPTATAQYEHLKRSLFRYNNTLYVATTDISKGDTIVPNTNCSTVDVAKYINVTVGHPSVTESDYFSVSTLGYVRYGHVIDFLIAGNATANLTAGTNYTVRMSGLPKPLIDWMPAVYSLAIQGGITISKDGDGATFNFSPTVAIPSGRYMSFRIIYLGE